MESRFAKAAVFRSAGQPLTIEEFAVPVPRDGETLVRIRCATICGSDLHTYAGRRHAPSPSILGHEMTGTVEATSGVGCGVEVGDRVTWSMVWSCGECGMCRRGLHAKCDTLFKFGHAAISATSQFTGGFAEYCLLPAGTSIFAVPDGIPDAVASIANCATATVAACFRKAGPVVGCKVVVLGAGMLGLNACAMARDLGASEVFVVESNPARTALAVEFGATAGEPPPDRAAVVMDFTGSPEAMEVALAYLGTGATLILAGAVFPSRPIQIAAEQVVRKCLRIEGIHNYSPQDLGAALDFLTRTQYPFATLIEGRFTLEQINEAFAYANTHKPPRVAIYP